MPNDIEEVDRAKPIEWQYIASTVNIDPFNMLLDNYVWYLEKLELKHRIDKPMHKRKRSSDERKARKAAKENKTEPKKGTAEKTLAEIEV